MTGPPLLNPVVVYVPPSVPAVRSGGAALAQYRPGPAPWPRSLPVPIDAELAPATADRGSGTSPASAFTAQQIAQGAAYRPGATILAQARSAYAAAAKQNDATAPRPGQILDTTI